MTISVHLLAFSVLEREGRSLVPVAVYDWRSIKGGGRRREEGGGRREEELVKILYHSGMHRF
ncbi:MAG: hypothetical protein HC866_18590 [Leptolyngbyaceae cyanobacterium RU_5_1]|nr:hypothetical protein [Leptolyngbyaceae cyanobacterium RU_5_1]